MVKGVAHITGGGFIENIPRMIPDGLAAEIELGTWPVLPIFDVLEKAGNIDHKEMYNIFNMGIGMVLASRRSTRADEAHEAARRQQRARLRARPDRSRHHRHANRTEVTRFPQERNNMGQKVLVIGSGAREHTIAYTLHARHRASTKSPWLPGNPGMELKDGIHTTQLSQSNHAALIEFVKQQWL